MSPQSISIPDAEARQTALDPERSFIVQAPAGSGKTGLLIQRYLSLLSRVGCPEEIVAITFTRKAAAEMRERVISALRRASLPDEAGENGNDHERTTLALARKAAEKDANSGWDIMRNPSRLRISTIDSLCASLARRMPVLSGFGMQPRIFEDAKRLYREAAANTVMELESTMAWSDSLESLIRHLDNNLGKVERLIAEMLSRRDQWLRHVVEAKDVRLQREGLENALCAVIENALENARRHMPETVAYRLPALARFAAENVFPGAPGAKICECLELREIPACIPDELETWKAIAELLLTQSGNVRKNADKRIGFPPGPSGAGGEKSDKAVFAQKKAEFKAVLEDARCCEIFPAALGAVRQLPDPYYTEEQWQLVEALFEILKLSVAHLRLVFEKYGGADFTEISLRAQYALGEADAPTDLALVLDYGIHHLLVDEFQDTSISQFELFLRLTAGWGPGDAKTFFGVGDPMQSIYSFREAEVGLFLRAWEAGLGPHLPLQRLRLIANFRSDKGIVDWANRTFVHVFPEKSDPATGAVAYSSSEAVHPEGYQPAVDFHPVIDGDDDHVAEIAVERIQSARRINPGQSIAVLVRSRSHLKKILPGLRQAGIRYRAVEIDPLGKRPVISDLTALTRALSHPADRVAWLALLRAPWCGLSLSDLFVLAGDDHKTTISDCFRDPGRLAEMSEDGRVRLERIMPVLQGAMQMRGRQTLRRLVEHAWTALGGPACVKAADIHDASVYFDFLAKNIDKGVIADERAFEDALMDLFSHPEPEADDLLQIMTIHKAKGLEFDTVILPGLEKAPRGDSEKLLLWQEIPDDSRSGTGFLLAPIAETGAGEDRTYSYINRLNQEKNAHEVRRLLYVAATRARRKLEMIGCVKRSSAGAPVFPDKRSLLFCLWPAVADVFLSACEETTDQGQAHTAAQDADDSIKADFPEMQPCIRRLPLSWQAPPPPADISSQAQGATAPGDMAKTDVLFDWAGITVRMIGTVVHKWLRIICETGMEGWDATRICRVSGKIRADLLKLGMGREGVDEAAEGVISALQSTLADDTGRWLLCGHHGGKCEYPIAGMIDGRMVYVVIDRTFIDEKGIRWIVDYKSGIHRGGDIDEFMARERMRYDQQTALYADLMNGKDPGRQIRRALYFPMFKGWCPFPDSYGGPIRR